MMDAQIMTRDSLDLDRRMRILILSSFYAPEQTGIGPYTTGLAEHLAGRGHDVTVITGMPSYPQWRVHPNYRGLLRRQELLEGVTVRRARNYVPRKQTTLRRALYEASFLLGGLNALCMPRPDAVLGVLPALSIGIITRVVARQFCSPYGLLFQDLTGQAASQSGVAGGHRVTGVISSVEGWVAQNARAIGIIADGFRPYLESLGVHPQRIHRVHNWVQIDKPRLTHAAVRRRLSLPEDGVICLHAGNMGFKQGLSNLIDCARLAIKTDPQLLFVIMGDGNQRSLLVDLASRYRLRNVRFLDIQPAELFSSLLAAVDVLLVNQRASVKDMALPSKLTSYLSSGRPIVAAVAPDSETATEIRRVGSGVLVQPDQPTRLLQAIRELVDDPALQQRLGRAGHSYANRHLSASQALAKLETMVQAIATSNFDREAANATAVSNLTGSAW
jgi:colanic acid biosynthesis glycosyl transferase WcaI